MDEYFGQAKQAASVIVSMKNFARIISVLPPRFTVQNIKMIFSTNKDGYSWSSGMYYILNLAFNLVFNLIFNDYFSEENNKWPHGPFVCCPVPLGRFKTIVSDKNRVFHERHRRDQGN